MFERNLLNPQPVDLPIHFANTFDDFQALIEEMMNRSLVITYPAKAIVDGLKQHSCSQVKLLEVVSGVMGEKRQHKQKVSSGPTRQLSDG